MIANKIADKTKSVSKKKSTKELHNNGETEEEEDVEIATSNKRYISPEERQQIIDESRLVPKKYVQIKVNIKQDTYLPKKYNKLLIN